MEPTILPSDPYPPTTWATGYTFDYPEYRLEDDVPVPCWCTEQSSWLPLPDGTWVECVVCGGEG